MLILSKKFILILIGLITFSDSAEAGSGKGIVDRDDYEEIYDRTILGRSLTSYFQSINGGWGKNLSSLRKSLKPKSNYLIIQALEPRLPMDLRSPEHFKQSVMSIGLVNLGTNSIGIGHVYMSWRCNIDGQMREGSVGMTGENEGQFESLVDSGHGLGAFFAKFTDGHLQTPELLDLEFEEELPVHTFAVEVDSSTCRNAVSFVRNFLFHPTKPYTSFGFIQDPEKFQGGGCGSFGTAVMQKSGMFGGLPIAKDFWRTLSTNSNLYGYNLEAPEDTEPFNFGRKDSNSVSLVRLFASSWNGKGAPLRVMDPEMALLFLKTAYRMTLEDIYEQSAQKGRDFIKSPHYQYRKYYGGDDDSLSKETVFDRHFDAQASNVVQNTRVWMSSLRRKGYRGTATMVGKTERPMWAIVFHKPM